MFLDIRPSEWHPILVHFPIALLMTATVVDLFQAMVRGRRLGSAFTLGLVLAGVTVGILAIATGIFAMNHDVVTRPAALLLLAWHERLGLFSIVWFAAILLLKAVDWRRQRPALRLHAALLSVGALALVGTGYLGGTLVYHYGLGTRLPRVAAKAPAVHAATAVRISPAAARALTEGGRVYLATCERCHGARSQGGIASAIGPATVMQLGGLASLQGFIAQSMPLGGPKLSPHEVRDVSAYLMGRAMRTGGGSAGAVAPAIPMPPGERLYIAYCEVCHGTNGVNHFALINKGGQVGLADYIDRTMPQNQRGILTLAQARAIAAFIGTIAPLPGQKADN